MTTDQRIATLEEKVKTLEAILMAGKGMTNKELRVRREVEEMRNDPEQWKRKHKTRREPCSINTLSKYTG